MAVEGRDIPLKDDVIVEGRVKVAGHFTEDPEPSFDGSTQGHQIIFETWAEELVTHSFGLDSTLLIYDRFFKIIRIDPVADTAQTQLLLEEKMGVGYKTVEGSLIEVQASADSFTWYPELNNYAFIAKIVLQLEPSVGVDPPAAGEFSVKAELRQGDEPLSVAQWVPLPAISGEQDFTIEIGQFLPHSQFSNIKFDFERFAAGTPGFQFQAAVHYATV